MTLAPNELNRRVRDWKRKGYDVYSITLPGEHQAVFRALTRSEFEDAVSGALVDDLGVKYLGSLYTDRYRELIRSAVISPDLLTTAELPESWPAACDKILAEAISRVSGWLDVNRLEEGLSEAREYATSLQGFLEGRICATFPGYKLEDMKNLTFAELMKLVGLSEMVTGELIDLRPWTDPQGYIKDMERQAKKAERAAKFSNAGIPAGSPRGPRERIDFRRMNSELAAGLRGEMGTIENYGRTGTD